MKQQKTSSGRAGEGTMTFSPSVIFRKKCYEKYQNGQYVEVPVDPAYLKSILWWWRSRPFIPDSTQQLLLPQKSNEQGWIAFRPPITLAAHHQKFKGGRRMAFLYELDARIHGRYRCQQPFCELTHDQIEALPSAWKESFQPTDFETKLAEIGGWNIVFPREMLHWSEKVIVSHFREIRRRLGLQVKEGSKFSWRAIELMDEKFFLRKILNDSERSQVSKARKFYETCQASK